MRTLAIFSVVLAIATSLWTCLPRQTERAQTEREDGKLLTQGGALVAPDRIASLRVVSWSKEDKAPQVFEVAKKNNQWIIPSHHDYPADGGSRVGETAGGVLNVPCGPLVADKADKHAEFGVVDPEKEGLTDEEGRGKRIKLMDEGGATLVDLVVGKRAPSGELYYVRSFDGEGVYTAKVQVDISTAFKDWVETDFLKVDRSKIHHVAVNDYSIEEKGEQRVLNQRAINEFSKKKDATEWSSTQTPEHKKASQSVVDGLLAEATSLRLTGVRPFNPGWLERRGFHQVFDEQGQPRGVYGQEGALEIGTEDGLRFILFLGRVALDDAQDKSEGAVDTPKTADAEATKATGHNRYMAVVATYDPKLDRTPRKLEPDKKDESKLGEAKDEKKDEGPSPDQIKEGQKKARDKALRFQRFFYVISDESFKKLRPELAKLFEDKEVGKDNQPGEKIPAEVVLTKLGSALQYADLKVGTGDEAAEGDTVEVHYTGWLESAGTKFDSSLDREPLKPFPFTLGKGEVIKGWDEGVKGMKTGGKRKLVLPSDLAYGKQGSPPKIPPDARLTFDVELLKVIKKAAPPVEPGKVESNPETLVPDAKKEKVQTPEPKPDAQTKTPVAKTEVAKTAEPVQPTQKVKDLE